jgi:hypothetical protein
MNFLQLCQKTALECDVSGGDTVPTTVVGQTGELARIVNWVKQSYTEIQNKHLSEPCWRWLRHTFTLSTTANDDTYAYTDCTDSTSGSAIIRFSNWRLNDCLDPPKIYLTSSGVGTETWMTWMPWEHFKTLYRRGTQNASYPIHISVDPQNNLVIGPKPNGIYTLTGDFYRSAQTLSDNSDTPEMPSQFHYLAVYEAMQKYGYFESAPEVLARGREAGSDLMRQLELNQLPSIQHRWEPLC